jgi:hypothetical protein
MIQKILEFISSLLKYLTEKQKAENIQNENTIEKCKEKVLEKESELESKMTDVNKVIHENSSEGDAKLNHMLKKLLSIGALVVLAGCMTPVVYVSNSDQVVSIEYNGVQGKFVPNATFSKMMEKIILCDELLLEKKAESLMKE